MKQEIADPSRLHVESERRRETRYPVQLSGRVQVPLIDLGDTALSGEAIIENLGRKGVGLRILDFKTDQFPILTELRHSFSLIYEIPTIRGRSYLCGEVVWVDFRAYESPPCARLGVELKAMMDAERHRYDRFLDQLTRRE